MTICLYLLAFIFNKSLCNIFFNSLFLSANTYQVYLYYSSLENPMDRGAWQATVHGITRVGHNLVTKPPPPPPSICYMQDAVFFIILAFVLKKPKGSPEKVGGVGKKQLVQNQIQLSSVQSLSHVWLFATPWIAACQASLSITNSLSLLELMPIKSMMPSSHLNLCVPFSSCPQSLPGSGSFPMSQLFAWSGQSTGVSASASVLPMNTQDWSPLGWTGWISLQSKGLSRLFFNTIVQKHQFFGAELSSQSNSHIHTWPLEKSALTRGTIGFCKTI